MVLRRGKFKKSVLKIANLLVSIHQRLNSLTNLRINSQENMRDYSMKADERPVNVTHVRENVSNRAMLGNFETKNLARFVIVHKFHNATKFSTILWVCESAHVSNRI